MLVLGLDICVAPAGAVSAAALWTDITVNVLRSHFDQRAGVSGFSFAAKMHTHIITIPFKDENL